MQKDEILQLLADEDIQKAVKDCVGKGSLISINNENKKLETKISQLTELSETRLKEISNLNTKATQAINEKNTQIQSLENKIRLTQQEFTNLTSINQQNLHKIASLSNDLSEKAKVIDTQTENLKMCYSQIKGLEGDLNKKTQEYSNLITEKNNIVQNLDKLKQDFSTLQAENVKIAKENDDFHQSIKAFTLYNSLKPEIFDKVSPIFKNVQNFAEFVLFGTASSTIENLYEVISYNVLRDDFSDLDSLSYIYYYFIDLFNTRSGKIVYKLDDLQENQAFEPVKHTKTKESLESGKILAIYIKGFEYLSPSKPLTKKSIVKVGN